MGIKRNPLQLDPFYSPGTHESLRHGLMGKFGPATATRAEGTQNGSVSSPRTLRGCTQQILKLGRKDPSDKGGLGGNATPGFPTTGHSWTNVFFPNQLRENTGKGHFLLPHPKQPGRGAKTQLGSFPGKIRREVLQGDPCSGGRGILSAG